ncbi:hypothetical protein TFKS16_1937 [Tannerella forsythia KS16]|uniref:Uncharacterized protein n=1 Tax=Tannerella forsythia (strain ATCC 43037 / JCM 10827 / CCUG 21028 A / KCTC 5666 / FDC 338) TaxID=203275 RepID=G8UIL6_TANFA|nr:hypothetical protein BFO_2165 [Tannerella forsythia 92A2]BAR49456.1 hypothetical protein TF3313_1984 [Tannerella forsythia 3313]BAR52158.1 hypothetical protein TFKS16_1937 [Tannerella forsythia KS16]
MADAPLKLKTFDDFSIKDLISFKVLNTSLFSIFLKCFAVQS